MCYVCKKLAATLNGIVLDALSAKERLDVLPCLLNGLTYRAVQSRIDDCKTLRTKSDTVVFTGENTYSYKLHWPADTKRDSRNILCGTVARKARTTKFLGEVTCRICLKRLEQLKLIDPVDKDTLMVTRVVHKMAISMKPDVRANDSRVALCGAKSDLSTLEVSLTPLMSRVTCPECQEIYPRVQASIAALQSHALKKGLTKFDSEEEPNNEVKQT